MPSCSPSVNVEPSIPPNQSAAFQQQLTAFFSEVLADPMRQRIAEQRMRPIMEHLAEYRAELVAKGDGRKHITDTTRRLRIMLRLCRAARWGGLTPAGVRQALHKLRAPRPGRKMLSLRTVNSYLHSLKGFANWMLNDYRAERSPCLGLKPVPETDEKRLRRALSPDEMIRLIDSANKGKAVAGIPGQERALMYVLALTTGLRAAEIESLTPASFRLEGSPHVVLEAAYSKHRRRDVVPLRADVAELVKAYLAQRIEPPKMPQRFRRLNRLFRRPGNTTRALRIDLAAAGIPYVVNGEYADFHAQRHTFISNLFDNGATPKVVQTLARHQDARLTLGRYAHATADAKQAAVEALPAFMAPAKSKGVGRGRKHS